MSNDVPYGIILTRTLHLSHGGNISVLRPACGDERVKQLVDERQGRLAAATSLGERLALNEPPAWGRADQGGTVRPACRRCVKALRRHAASLQQRAAAAEVWNERRHGS